VSRGTEKFFRVDFQKLKPDSIIDVQVGFMGGDVVNPTYRQVCEGDTNHVEVAQITYDTSKATYEDLVKFFFSMHDASTINRYVHRLDECTFGYYTTSTRTILTAIPSLLAALRTSVDKVMMQASSMPR